MARGRARAFAKYKGPGQVQPWTPGKWRVRLKLKSTIKATDVYKVFVCHGLEEIKNAKLPVGEMGHAHMKNRQGALVSREQGRCPIV